MGLTLTAKYRDAPEWDMGYMSFFRLRRDVAYTVSDEFGERYADITWGFMHQEEYDRIMDHLIGKYKVPKGLVYFLFLPDAGAKLTPLRCKAVLEQIESVSNNALYGYGARPKECIMTFEDFKNLLRECINRNKHLYWY